MKVLAKIAEIKSYGDKNMIDVIQALKNQGFMIIDDTVFDLLYQIKKHGQMQKTLYTNFEFKVIEGLKILMKKRRGIYLK